MMHKRNEGPQRTCVGCMRRDSQSRMLRIAAQANSLTLDEDRRMPGRGAYLHHNNGCITDFVHRRIRELRSLRRKPSFDERQKLAELIHARLDSSAALK